MVRSHGPPETRLALGGTSVGKVAVVGVVEVRISIAKGALLSHIWVIIVNLLVSATSISSITSSCGTSYACLGTL